MFVALFVVEAVSIAGRRQVVRSVDVAGQVDAGCIQTALLNSTQVF